jgi:hypothetical protein
MMEMPPHAIGHVQAAGHVFGLGLDLLHAHTIEVQALHPVEQALVGCRTDAVEIEGAHTHG